MPPLQSLGRLMLWLCGSFVFMTFLASMGLLMASRMAELDVFSTLKVVLMIVSFLIVDFTLFVLMVFSVIRGAMSLLDINVYQGIRASVRMIA